MYLKYKLLLIFFTIAFAARAQSDDTNPWRIKGFVDTYHALRAKAPNNLVRLTSITTRDIGDCVQDDSSSFGERQTAFVSPTLSHRWI